MQKLSFKNLHLKMNFYFTRRIRWGGQRIQDFGQAVCSERENLTVVANLHIK